MKYILRKNIYVNRVDNQLLVLDKNRDKYYVLDNSHAVVLEHIINNPSSEKEICDSLERRFVISNFNQIIHCTIEELIESGFIEYEK